MRRSASDLWERFANGQCLCYTIRIISQCDLKGLSSVIIPVKNTPLHRRSHVPLPYAAAARRTRWGQHRRELKIMSPASAPIQLCGTDRPSECQPTPRASTPIGDESRVGGRLRETGQEDLKGKARVRTQKPTRIDFSVPFPDGRRTASLSSKHENRQRQHPEDAKHGGVRVVGG